ncbi:MAG: FG-GAP-like repeat-containing protein, partial [Planctomycetes bacterium]|nr:FG-GAP-like repeat-containing protein [Planctomycetota bacterium]
MNSHNRLILKLILALLSAVVSLSNACGSALAVDCNRNGVDDQVDISGAASADCNENGIPDECEFAPLQFGLREQALSVERFPRALTSGDFDGDGDNDLVTANKNADTSSTLSLLNNQGEGVFTRTDIPAGVRASSIESADLDADGDRDLVTANCFPSERFWNDGSGVFSEPVSIEVNR